MKSRNRRGGSRTGVGNYMLSTIRKRGQYQTMYHTGYDSPKFTPVERGRQVHQKTCSPGQMGKERALGFTRRGNPSVLVSYIRRPIVRVLMVFGLSKSTPYNPLLPTGVILYHIIPLFFLLSKKAFKKQSNFPQFSPFPA